jgi:hypothetical protein
MKFYTTTAHAPTNPPPFSDEEINALSREKAKPYRKDRDNLSRHYNFLLEYEGGQIEWKNMTDSQKRYLWAIKAIVKGML